VAKVAPSDSTVLITGETGNRQELVERAIHKRSQRAGRAFVQGKRAAIPFFNRIRNCSAMRKEPSRAPYSGA